MAKTIVSTKLYKIEFLSLANILHGVFKQQSLVV